MEFKNLVIQTINHENIKSSQKVYIKNCIINTIDFMAFESDSKIIIENCIIENFLIHSCWFKEGLIFTNNQVLNYIDYQMGGHNQEVITIEKNIFHDFFNFFDCMFTNDLIVQDNIFLKGANLLGNEGEGWKSTFDKKLDVKNNIGDLDINGTRP